MAKAHASFNTITGESTYSSGQVETLLEFVRQPSALRVDRERAVIFGVKVCGLASDNGRTYSPEALRKALPLYEGLAVNIDHPQRADTERSSLDRFGKLVNVRIEEGGLYADLYFLKSHPMAERIVEAAERMPDLFGLSHNAAGKMERRGDTVYVTEITAVRSVDLVADPATTKGLFESRKSMADKLKEQEEMPAEAPAADPMAGQDPMELLGKVAGMLAASGDQAQHDLAKKILNMLKPETAEEPAAEQEDGEEEKPDEEEKPMESLKRKVAVLELCLAEGVKLSPVQQKAACALTGAELVEFIGDLKGTKPNGQQKPRATGPRPMKEAKGDDNGITVPALADGKALAAWLAE